MRYYVINPSLGHKVEKKPSGRKKRTSMTYSLSLSLCVYIITLESRFLLNSTSLQSDDVQKFPVERDKDDALHIVCS